MEPALNFFDRLILFFAPKWGAQRVRARVLARHFEAASVGRRTDGWHRRNTDANAAAGGAALSHLRGQARDLVRNNPWAHRGLGRIETAVVGWGIRPKAKVRDAKRVSEVWKKWAETTQCDAAGRLSFYGIQALIVRTVVESGEVLIRRRRRRPEDGLAIPLQLQILEPDHIDTSLDGIKGPAGGDIIQGVEFDAIGRRVAYWLFDQHPGSRQFTNPQSRRIPASEILHVFRQDRPAQVRGVSWFAPVGVRLHDFDEFEDATLMKQKIAACLAAFVTDLDGESSPLGPGGVSGDQPIDVFEPGMVINLPPGKQVTTTNPPASTDHQAYSTTSLRGVAAGLGPTYEDLTGDYSQVNYSSARMARLAFNADVHHWRWNMLVPQFCTPAWAWIIEALALVGVEADENVKWTPPPVQMLDPDKEASANIRAVRSGQKSLTEMVQEQGYDPDEFWEEYAADIKKLDELGIVLDSDASKMTGAGQLHPPPPAPSDSKQEPAATDERAYEEIRVAYTAALDSERKRADEAIERIGAMRAAVAEDDERINAEIARRDEQHAAALDAERKRGDAERDRADEERLRADTLVAAERERAAAELARERAARERADARVYEAERERTEALLSAERYRAAAELAAERVVRMEAELAQARAGAAAQT